LEIWDISSDTATAKQPLSNIQQVEALPSGCLVRAQNKSRLFTKDGNEIKLVSKYETTSAVGWTGKEILVSSLDSLGMYNPNGTLKAEYKADIGVTSVARCGEWLILGFKDGNIERLSLNRSIGKDSHLFEETPASPVAYIREGPSNTVIVGYANGFLGIWNLQTGSLLDSARLHGPVRHMTLKNGRLYAASELGDHIALDLQVFEKEYCDLLKEIWQQVPIVWETGLPIKRPPPSDHPCSGRN
jgi:hypothetical protein